MTTLPQKFSLSQDVQRQLAVVFNKRLQGAKERFQERMQEALASKVAPMATAPQPMAALGGGWTEYMTDLTQRSVLFWETLLQRGNQYVEHQRAGMPPVLHFDYETVLDARTFARPVNYALLRITPPEGVKVDPKRRPYVIIDPRAGHGPGIGGFKDDSQVGVALRSGHPVYFVIFFPHPEPGQTLLDVCECEAVFVRKVRELHPDSAKPAIVGNCQGGWAAMMLAASNPEDTGPIVINGAPMSYWGGAWEEGDNDNPMRYSGGLLGGTWLSSFVSDLSNGVFDGAWLVQNFENLNPANTFWKKYYHLFANVDTEPQRFLEFERWWGGFFLLNREEIEFITQNLFVGNKLWSGGIKAQSGHYLDLREIRSPIVLFASMGDNITPPEQAFNWVADVYGSTEEIKARGQVIVGLLHQDIGHLGIFVSGAVAKKEHAQIVSVLKSIEALPPGLYGMQIQTIESKNGEKSYEVSFVERRLEEVVAKLNRFERRDEKAFEAVLPVSEFNQRAYELFAQPLVQALSSEPAAKLARDLHPERMQRWAISDINPWLAWLKPAAETVRAQRKPIGPDHPWRQLEAAGSELIAASLDYYRDVSNAFSEAAFFELYGNLFALTAADIDGKQKIEQAVELGQLPVVKAALADVGKGGYPEAVTRIGFLLQRHGQPLPLSRLELRAELVDKHRALLPEGTPDELRRTRGVQEIIVRFDPDAALATLPSLLSDSADRKKLFKLVDAIIEDMRAAGQEPTQEQYAAWEKVQKVLGRAKRAGSK
jgi:pimeloyl-ACP methyl ester carboxylesterase